MHANERKLQGGPIMRANLPVLEGQLCHTNLPFNPIRMSDAIPAHFLFETVDLAAGGHLYSV